MVRTKLSARRDYCRSMALEPRRALCARKSAPLPPQEPRELSESEWLELMELEKKPCGVCKISLSVEDMHERFGDVYRGEGWEMLLCESCHRDSDGKVRFFEVAVYSLQEP
eukprot:777468-Pyramimonas_sp.AAC.2